MGGAVGEIMKEVEREKGWKLSWVKIEKINGVKWIVIL